MKRRNLISRMAICLYLVLACVLSSCGTKEPIERYCGGVIVYKGDAPIGDWFELKYDGELTGRIYLHKIDFEKYSIGDTIKCTKADSLTYAR